MFTIDDLFEILTYLKTGTYSSLDNNIKILSENEKAKSQLFFENIIDQNCFISNDYIRLKNFLIDWYSSHKTIISSQRQSSDIFYLPEKHINELFKSFGFNISLNLLSSYTKANLFLDLVNLYKIKGTPEALFSILSYFGFSNCDIAEYWLKKDNLGNLIFRSESIISSQAETISWADITFNDMTTNDPHWMQTYQQVINLLNQNKLALPVKSPYIGVRPIYDIVSMNAVCAALSRRFRDDYNEWLISGQTSNDKINLTNLQYSVSFLELYIACCYTINEFGNRTTGTSNEKLLCYDSTNENDFSYIQTLYNSYISIIPETREQQRLKFIEFIDLFTIDTTSSFLLSVNDPPTLLNNINSEFKDLIDSYISLGKIEDITTSFLLDLSDWIFDNFQAQYYDLAGFVLDLRSFETFKNILNFFKPIRARISVFQLAYLIRDKLKDSIISEDIIHDNLQETIVDYDTATSDSTSFLDYGRKCYDSTNYFDVGLCDDRDGPQISDSPYIVDLTNITDILNYHPWYSSSVHIESNLTGSEFDDYILPSGGFSDFDYGMIFDSYFGNDACVITYSDIEFSYILLGNIKTDSILKYDLTGNFRQIYTNLLPDEEIIPEINVNYIFIGDIINNSIYKYTFEGNIEDVYTNIL